MTYSDEMQLLLALSFGLWLSSRRHFGFPALGFAALALVFALGLGSTLTRSAWLAAAFSCAVQIWFHVRARWVKLFLPAALILAAFGTNAAMQHWRGVGLIDFQEGSSSYRLLMWQDGLRLIRQHPWFGVGLNSIRDSWQSFDLAAYRLTGIRSHFHSTPIQIAVELGLPVLLAWLTLMGLYWWMLVKLVRSARDQADTTVYGVSLGILGGTSGFLLSSLVQYNFGDSEVVLLFWFLMGLALSLRRHVENAPGAGRQSDVPFSAVSA
jgi:O-antigen ligase